MAIKLACNSPHICTSCLKWADAASVSLEALSGGGQTFNGFFLTPHRAKKFAKSSFGRKSHNLHYERLTSILFKTKQSNRDIMKKIFSKKRKFDFHVL